MNRRLWVILAVVVIEIGMRLLYPSLAMDALVYTLITRCMQAALILALTWSLCGIKTPTPAKELAIGLSASLAFAALVLLADACSRIWMHDGVLSALLAKQTVRNPWLFLLAGCVLGPLVEELLFRGLVQAWLAQRLPMLLAVVFSALFFACMHGYLAPVQLIGGLLFAGLFAWRGNIWAAWVLHMLANTGIWLFPLIYPYVMPWLRTLAGAAR